MEYSLQGYFDIGVSYGLGDDVFNAPDDATVPDILKIGIHNPLGLGLLHRIDRNSPIIHLWREKASLKLDDEEMELGYDDSTRKSPEGEADFELFKQEIRHLVENHPISLCHLTIYAIGVVFIRLDFERGIPNRHLQGFAHCFEYAAYLEPVSTALLNAARSAAETALKTAIPKWSIWKPWVRRSVGVGIQSLSKRPDPEILKDQEGYEESRLFTGFTHVAMCIDQDDRDEIEEIKKIVLPSKHGIDEPDSEPISFEYHGVIHFNWSACVVEPKSFDDPDESPKQQIQRMLLCIQIAHSFHGACDAFRRLFFYETIQQAAGYIKGESGGRNHVELNRLRTLALAMVTLTRFASVAVAEEDQTYFTAYDKYAKLDELHDIIIKHCDILFNVQQAEADEEQIERELFLNTVALFLAGFALLGVLTDMYGFATDSGDLFGVDVLRVEVLTAIVILVLLILLLLRRKITRRRSWRRY